MAAQKPTAQTNEDDIGAVRVIDEVIRIMAALAAQEVPGVLGMSGGLAEDLSRMLGKDTASEGVRFKVNGSLLQLSVYLNMEYGYCLPEVALAVQEKVKKAIEEMTGYQVKSVDVHVEGVGRRKDPSLLPEHPGEAETLMEKSIADGEGAEPEEELDKRRAMFFEEE